MGEAGSNRSAPAEASEIAEQFSGSNVQVFRASKGNLAMAPIMLAIFGFAAGSGLYFIISSYTDPANHLQDRGIGYMVLTVFGAMFVLSIYMTVITLRKYEISEHSLRESSPLGVRTIFWADIIGIDPGKGTPDADVTLILRGGAKRTISFSLLDKKAPELREALLQHTQDLRNQQLAEFIGADGNLPMSPPWASIIGIVISLGLMAFTWYASTHPNSTQDVSALFMFMQVFWVLLLALFGWGYTRKIQWDSNGITVSSIVSKKHIPWAAIESAFCRNLNTKNGQTELLTVIAGSQKIVLGASMPSYTLLKELILKKASEASLKAGETDLIKAEVAENKQGNWIIAICLVLLLGVMGVLGTMFFQKRAILQNLERSGVSAMAEVTGRDCGCDSHLIRDVEYKFQAGGLVYTGEWRLTKGLPSMHIGDRAEVVYLPGNPSVNRLQMLMDTSGGIASFVFMMVLLGMYLLMIGLVVVERNKKRVRKQAQDQSAD